VSMYPAARLLGGYWIHLDQSSPERRSLGTGRWLMLLTIVSASLCTMAGCERPTRIIFASDSCGTAGDEFDFDLFTLTPDGRRVTRLTYHPRVAAEDAHAMMAGGKISPKFPAVSPDGKTVAFSGWGPNMAMHIYTMGIDGSSIRDLMDGYTSCHSPRWSPSGDRIAFARWGPHVKEPGICTIRPDGSDLRVLASGEYVPGRGDTDYAGLDWSPDGRRIVFARSGSDDRAFLQSLYIMNADGTSVKAFTQPALYWEDREPRWSPDGKQIAYLSRRGATWDLSVSDAPPVDAVDVNAAEASSRTLLTDVGEFSWSPDGRRLVMVGTADGTNQLWTCDSKGRNPIKLTFDAGNCTSPLLVEGFSGAVIGG
jgi:dipeptidyl aminopeptidase/acylaminoacyl peptidase